MKTTEQTLSTQQLLSIIENKRFGVEYQPIVEVSNLNIYAYEALSRFYDDHNQLIAPDLVFSALHHNPLSLFQVELAQKKLQLQHAPSHGKLFVNLDQDSFFACVDPDSSGQPEDINPFIELFLKFTNNDLVVELIENSEINDAKMSVEMINLMASSNISTALDDIFNEQSMISTTVLERVDFMKLDRFVVTNRQQSGFLLLVKAMIAYSKSAGKKTILEGVETAEDFEFAKSLGVDYVQGFLFKEQFVRFTPPEITG